MARWLPADGTGTARRPESINTEIQPRAGESGPGTRYIGAVPLFMDIHRKVDGLTPEAARAAHQKDLEVQGRSGVRFIRYWYDEKTGMVFCLSEAPSAAAVNAAHRDAHGLQADEVIEVAEGT
jgi:hypothetical protein